MPVAPVRFVDPLLDSVHSLSNHLINYVRVVLEMCTGMNVNFYVKFWDSWTILARMRMHG
jgi:hypothetical protein